MVLECNCDMPWWAYCDFLQDQGIDVSSLRAFDVEEVFVTGQAFRVDYEEYYTGDDNSACCPDEAVSNEGNGYDLFGDGYGIHEDGEEVIDDYFVRFNEYYGM